MTLWPRNRWKQVLAVALVVLVVPYLFSRVASTSRRVRVCHAPAAIAPARDRTGLRIATYNVAHGRGLAESNWRGGSAGVRRERLDRIGELLIELDADVVVLNEVDFDASWSHGVDQAEYLARRAGYPYWATQRNLDFRVLLRTWRFGNAVLSRWPIEEAQEIPLPGYAAWETLLAGKKRGVLCTIDAPSGRFRVAAVHLSHRSHRVRVDSADVIAELLDPNKPPLLVAGDLNAAPPPTDQEPRLAADNPFARLEAAGMLRRPADDDVRMTFPSPQPRSAIDWILIPTDWTYDDYRVVDSTLSDHRPVIAEASARKTDPLPDPRAARPPAARTPILDKGRRNVPEAP